MVFFIDESLIFLGLFLFFLWTFPVFSFVVFVIYFIFCVFRGIYKATQADRPKFSFNKDRFTPRI